MATSSSPSFTQPSPIPLASRTALLLIDNQQAFTHPSYFGTVRSNPNYEANSTALLSAFRKDNARGTQNDTTPPSYGGRADDINDDHNDRPLIIHIKHKNPSPTSSSSPFHPDGEFSRGPSHASYRDFFPWATPLPAGGERVLEKTVHSAFIGTELEILLRGRGVNTLVIQGLTTDHCVSTTVRMAEDLGICDVGGRKGRIILAGDATATFNKGNLDAETVQKVHLQSLSGEFAEILDTKTILGLLTDS